VKKKPWAAPAISLRQGGRGTRGARAVGGRHGPEKIVCLNWPRVQLFHHKKSHVWVQKMIWGLGTAGDDSVHGRGRALRAGPAAGVDSARAKEERRFWHRHRDFDTRLKPGHNSTGNPRCTVFCDWGAGARRWRPRQGGQRAAGGGTVSRKKKRLDRATKKHGGRLFLRGGDRAAEGQSDPQPVRRPPRSNRRTGRARLFWRTTLQNRRPICRARRARMPRSAGKNFQKKGSDSRRWWAGGAGDPGQNAIKLGRPKAIPIRPGICRLVAPSIDRQGFFFCVGGSRGEMLRADGAHGLSMGGGVHWVRPI